ncbi:unnamed protein product [Danaus chrysippus]|uniref:(African queen) hypothetical protein n=1 Tax=Danaus chrysippus TaxID=151541 RepID=A0A8J2QZG0_9NEOP|nr:unnamed protein product [Danaus chrysippus]
MLAQPKNRVQAIKSKFESLKTENEVLVGRKVNHLNKQFIQTSQTTRNVNIENIETKPSFENKVDDEWSPKPNTSYLYSKSDVKRSLTDTKTSLTRQISDPGKKLHRSHAFRCDRSQKINQSPKRHGSCNGRSETSDFTLKMGDRKLSKERLKLLGNFLEEQMKKENFVPPDHINSSDDVDAKVSDSIPDSEVPKHILDQYAKVVKSKSDNRQDSMTDSGVSSETENIEEEKNKIKKLVSQYEQAPNEDVKPNLEAMNDISASSETMKLERKNPHLILTDTLKKALKQPLPPGPPPKKPPRTFAAPTIQESPEKKDTKKMLEKLELVLQKREAVHDKPIHDVKIEQAKPKEIHYLCTELLDITQRGLNPVNQSLRDPLSKCFNSLNCAIINNSTLSLPYTRLSAEACHTCSNDQLNTDRISTFLSEKCSKCQSNATSEGFKCHLSCKCRDEKSEFFVNEHIYDVPFVEVKCKSEYGALNAVQSRSMEDLKVDEEKIYDLPCEESRPQTPEIKSEFQKLRDNFEKPKEVTVPLKVWKSSENVSKDFKIAKITMEKKFSTDAKRYRKNVMSLPKRDNQLDVDRENLNRLMTEIYETVTAACNMEENKPGSFPTDLSDTSEESVKLTRSLTEKRKNYVRRVSSRVAYLDKNAKNNRFRHQTSICSYKSEIIDNPYSTFRSWKSFRSSQGNLSRMKNDSDSIDSKQNLTDSSGNLITNVEDMDNLSIDEKMGCVDIDLPFEPREKGLFNFCLLVGLNYMTGEAYVKNVFPNQVQVPPHIENLIFPETISSTSVTDTEKITQSYSLVLTDERGERSYGYCRRVLPEGATTCLPLCYCLIGKYRAPGFYYKILQEIESHHGSSDIEMNMILQQLFETDFPNPGENISIMYTNDAKNKCRTLPDMRHTERIITPGNSLPEYYDLENNNEPKKYDCIERPRCRTIKMALDPRAEENSLCVMLDHLGAGLAIKVFGSLLLERKVIIMGDQLSIISSCLEALQHVLYPFVWQQPLISAIPEQIAGDVLSAPLPMLAGMLEHPATGLQDGMLIDLTNPSKVLFYQGDESTILPTSAYKLLKTSLHMESIKHKDKSEDMKTRNVMISEAFLRFFVDILGDFWRFFSMGELNDGDLGKDGVIFDKDSFVKQTSSKQNQYFLEWFTETAMFNHFIQNMAVCYKTAPHTPATYHANLETNLVDLVDTPLPNFYELFFERIKSRSKSQNGDKLNYKNAVNKKVKMLKTKLRDLVA